MSENLPISRLPAEPLPDIRQFGTLNQVRVWQHYLNRDEFRIFCRSGRPDSSHSAVTYGFYKLVGATLALKAGHRQKGLLDGVPSV